LDNGDKAEIVTVFLNFPSATHIQGGPGNNGMALKFSDSTGKRGAAIRSLWSQVEKIGDKHSRS